MGYSSSQSVRDLQNSSSAPTILCVEDNEDLAQIMHEALSQYNWLQATSLKQARKAITESTPDLVLLDIGLPDGSGMDFLRELRKLPAGSPAVVIVTGHSDPETVREGYRELADDVLLKPFSPDELCGRVEGRLALRKIYRNNAIGVIMKGRLIVDTKQCVMGIQENGQVRQVEFTDKELGILVALIKSDSQVLTRQDLLRDVWSGIPVNERTIDTHVSRVRKKLAGADYTIAGCYGKGYQLIRKS